MAMDMKETRDKRSSVANQPMETLHVLERPGGTGGLLRWVQEDHGNGNGTGGGGMVNIQKSLGFIEL